MKIIYLDTETTGLDPLKHAIIQIAGIIEIDGKEVEKINLRCRPFPGQEMTAEALEINGHTEAEVMALPDPREAYRGFSATLAKYVNKFDRTDKFHHVGYNARFDSDFIRAWYQRNADKYFGSWFYFPPIDVMNLAATALMNKHAALPNFKLATVCKEFACEKEREWHDAMDDIEATRDLFKLLQVVEKESLE